MQMMKRPFYMHRTFREVSTKMAQDWYATNFYGVISDNVFNIVKMGRVLDAWHSTCNAHFANLLSKDILDKNVTTSLVAVLKQFRHPNLEKAIVERGGSNIKTPAATCWYTYCDCCKCWKYNLNFMQLAIDGKKIKPNVKNLIFDEEFIDRIDKMISPLYPVSVVLYKVQSTNCCLAANLWLPLRPDVPHLQKFCEHRKKQALNQFALSAFYLNPYFDKLKLDADQMNTVTDF